MTRAGILVFNDCLRWSQSDVRSDWRPGTRTRRAFSRPAAVAAFLACPFWCRAGANASVGRTLRTCGVERGLLAQECALSQSQAGRQGLQRHRNCGGNPVVAKTILGLGGWVVWRAVVRWMQSHVLVVGTAAFGRRTKAPWLSMSLAKLRMMGSA